MSFPFAILCLFAQSCQTLCDPMDCNLQDSSPWGFSRPILEWVAMPSSRGSGFPTQDWTRSSALQVESLPFEPPGKSKNTEVGSLTLLKGMFPIQESKWGFLHCRRNLYQLIYSGTHTLLFYIFEFIAGWIPKVFILASFVFKDVRAQGDSLHGFAFRQIKTV